MTSQSQLILQKTILTPKAKLRKNQHPKIASALNEGLRYQQTNIILFLGLLGTEFYIKKKFSTFLKVLSKFY